MGKTASYLKAKRLAKSGAWSGGPFTAVPRPDLVMYHCVATQMELYYQTVIHSVGSLMYSYIQLIASYNVMIAS